MFLLNKNEDTLKLFFVIDDAYLTPLCQRVQSIFVQHKDKIERVGLILKVSHKLPVYVA